MDECPRSCEGKIEIFPLSAEHIDAISSLEKNCFSEPWSKDTFVSLLSNPLAVYVVAMCGDKLVGYAGMYHILTEGQLMNIAVLPEYRRQGIAEKMFGHLLEYAHDNDIEIVTLEVRASNDSAIAFYEKLGFGKDGMRKDYYSLPREDAVLMSLNI